MSPLFKREIDERPENISYAKGENKCVTGKDAKRQTIIFLYILSFFRK